MPKIEFPLGAIRRLIKRLFWNLRVSAYRPKALQQNLENVQTIVSLTSYPARIGQLHLTLKSLLWQTQPYLRIVVVLSRIEFPNGEKSLPKKLVKLLNSNPSLEVLWVDDNIRSYKKLLPALAAFPDKSIITVDDDVIYPPNLVEELTAAAERHPGSIVGSRAARMLFDSDSLAPYDTWPAADFEEPSYKVFLTGRGGILYPAGSLHRDVLNSEKCMQLCPDADDLWFKVMGIKQKCKSVAVNLGDDFPGNFASQGTALFRANVLDHANDRILPSLLQELGLTAESFEDGD